MRACKTHPDDAELVLRLLRLDLAQLEVDRLDLAFLDGRLKLQIEVEHRLRL